MNTKRWFLGTSVFLVALVSPAAGAWADETPSKPMHPAAWEVGTLVTAGAVGQYCDVAIDGSGDMHVVYLDSDTGELYTLSRTSGVWQSPQVVDPVGNASGHCSISAAGAGVLRLAWRRGGTNSLVYADPVLRSDEWVIGEVTSSPDDIGAYLSLHQSEAGTLSVSCQNTTQESLVWTTRDGLGAWSSLVAVDPGPNRGYHSDHTIRPGAGYTFSERGTGQGMLLYADPVLRSDEWVIGDVTSSPDDIGAYLSLHQSEAGTLSVSCQNTTQESLVWTTRDGLGAWSSLVTVDPGPSRGYHSDHTIRPGAGYTFSERGTGQGMLLYADPVLRSNSWTIGIVREQGDAGQYVSAIRMPDGKVAASFYFFDGAGLGSVAAAYNVGVADSWVVRSVADSVGTTASPNVHPDLAMTPDWRGFVAYRNSLDGFLYCAFNDSVVTGVGDVVVPEGGTTPVFALYPNYPNPFNPQTTIAYAIRETGRVHIAIYDVAGRLVKTLVDDVRLAGRHRATWDGSDERGLEAASGVYFVRLAASGSVQTRKLVLVK